MCQVTCFDELLGIQLAKKNVNALIHKWSEIRAHKHWETKAYFSHCRKVCLPKLVQKEDVSPFKGKMPLLSHQLVCEVP